jgi:hypothetical protein
MWRQPPPIDRLVLTAIKYELRRETIREERLLEDVTYFEFAMADVLAELHFVCDGVARGVLGFHKCRLRIGQVDPFLIDDQLERGNNSTSLSPSWATNLSNVVWFPPFVIIPRRHGAVASHLRSAPPQIRDNGRQRAGNQLLLPLLCRRSVSYPSTRSQPSGRDLLKPHRL